MNSLCLKGLNTVLIVREADEMKIARRFSAGYSVNKHPQSPRSGRQNFRWRSSISDLCRPFHGLAIYSRSDPSAEALGYVHTVRYRGRTPFRFLEKDK